MGKFLDRYHLLKLNQDQINNLNTPISHSKIETVIKILQTKRCPGPDGFSTESYWSFKEAIKEILPKLLHKIEMEGTFSTLLYEANIQ